MRFFVFFIALLFSSFALADSELVYSYVYSKNESNEQKAYDRLDQKLAEYRSNYPDRSYTGEVLETATQLKVVIYETAGEPEEQCEAGQSESLTVSASAAASGSACYQSCEYSLGGPSAYVEGDNGQVETWTFWDATSTGDACDPEDESSEPAPAEDGCITGAGGQEVCLSDEPPDDLPEGCVVNDAGKVSCIGDEELQCYEVDGKTVCPSNDAICGVDNGTFGCVDPQEEGCGYYNGKKICFDPNGERVTEDSPDHPDNGGNLDGDPTNDATDPRPESEGGDPNNQPGDQTGQGDGATEGTAREQLGELRQIDDKLKGIGDSLDNLEEANEGNGQQIQQEVEQGMDEAGDAAVGELDELIDDVDEPGPMKADDLGRFSDGLTDVLGAQSQCEDLTLGKGDLSLTLSCSDTAVIRDVLGFIVYLLTFWRLFQIVTRKPA